MTLEQAHQDALPGMPTARRRAPAPIAATQPIARVLVDSPLAHLDREFDYLVPARLDEHAQVGCRVSVMFAGNTLSGYVVERTDSSEHTGRLAPLRRANSPVPVLSAEVLALSEELARYYAGTRCDLLRLAIPPRHAATERQTWPVAAASAGSHPRPDADSQVVGLGPWPATPTSAAFLRRLRAGQGPRAAWCAPPWDERGRPAWPHAFAQAAAATNASGRGTILVVPHARALAQLERALSEAGIAAVARLSADDGPARRYREYLRVLGGEATVVIGTRHAAFAPVRDLGLIACWDEGSDLHCEPRAPYPHTRTVASMRAQLTGCALLLAGHGRSSETQQLVARGWVRDLPCDRTELRRLTPRMHALADIDLAAEGPLAAAQIPPRAWRLAQAAVAEGPVLIQVPRAGYAPALACGQCRQLSRCSHCQGPLTASSASVAACRWCGRLATDHACHNCGSTSLRAIAAGAERTAEDLGRAFPHIPIRRASGAAGTDQIGGESAIMIATPGAEAEASAGYRAGLLLDPSLALGRPDVDAGIEALRRWLNAAALVAPAPRGVVILTGAGDTAPAQALIRWDPAGYAERELAERTELGLPPARPTAAISGAADAVNRLLRRLPDQLGQRVLGPVETGDGTVRAIVQVPPQQRGELAEALRAAQATRSAHKEAGTLRVQVDPPMQI